MFFNGSRICISVYVASPLGNYLSHFPSSIFFPEAKRFMLVTLSAIQPSSSLLDVLCAPTYNIIMICSHVENNLDSGMLVTEDNLLSRITGRNQKLQTRLN